MRFDVQRVRKNIRQASTEDLLDRVTVYRAGMEPIAVDLAEAELRSRGIRQPEIDRHARERESTVLLLADGTAQSCSFCRRPAVRHAWGWHRLWGKLPVFPRRFAYCDEHCAD